MSQRRNHGQHIGAAVMAGALVIASIAGCQNRAGDCELNLVPCDTSTTTGTHDGGPPASCIPSDNEKAVSDTCGVFVSSAHGSDASGKGTKEAPYATLGAALKKGSTIYACAGATPYSEALAVPAGAVIFGGVDCASWKYVGTTTKTTLTADVGKIPLTLSTGAGTKLVDLHVLAADASGGDPGQSSIAVVADHATVEIEGCIFEAQGAADGAQGKPYSSAAKPGATGNNGHDACSASTVLGGDPVSSMCGDPDSSGGPGGIGTSVSGGPGGPGLPSGSMNGGLGEGGSACTTGTKGDDGPPGTAGAGAKETDLGTISASGYVGIAGASAGTGTPGQGGGGGGGAKGGTGAGKCSAGMAGGAGGGSGGSGGCGGAGGRGGNPGGSSIALISIEATLTMTNVTLKAGSAGKGGDGGPGQSGGDPGSGGKGGAVLTASALNPGCDGGPGGFGGAGGKGGGGRGGHAFGIAISGKAPPKSGWTAKAGSAGTGGKGDDAGGNMGDGADGKSADCWDFANGIACK